MNAAIATVLNDEYMYGALVMLFSLLKTSPSFNLDIVILCGDDLSEKNKERLLKIYRKIIFRKIDSRSYDSCKYDDRDRVWTFNCNVRFDVFELKDYDKVMFIDCDFFIQKDVLPLLSIKGDFIAAPTAKEFVPQCSNNKCFNGGLFVVGKKYLNKQTKEGLIKVSLSRPPLFEKWSSDEPILNTYFKKVKYVDKSYNFLVSLLTNNTDLYSNNFHFNGSLKPWNSINTLSFVSDYTLDSFCKKYGTAGLIKFKKIQSLYFDSLNKVLDYVN